MFCHSFRETPVLHFCFVVIVFLLFEKCTYVFVAYHNKFCGHLIFQTINKLGSFSKVRKGENWDVVAQYGHSFATHMHVTDEKYATRFSGVLNEGFSSGWCNLALMIFFVHLFILGIFSTKCNPPQTVDHSWWSTPIRFASRRLRFCSIDKRRPDKDTRYWLYYTVHDWRRHSLSPSP